ncbi:hypothetical protein Pcinc_009154 [Petrolisthes cinctipes]|uniref:Laccase n=1 Tax=Petrolisthes cinctipes TaxID=88211 RepID=A0AAE1G591_PETCI|nr:hypothetical protein Pcinc_009154 [Petrolisthes cinctipes]
MMAVGGVISFSLILLLVGTGTLILPSYTNAQDQNEGKEEGWMEGVATLSLNPLHPHLNQPIPPFGEEEGWMERQLARPVNHHLLQTLLGDLKEGHVGEVYWQQVLDTLKGNEMVYGDGEDGEEEEGGEEEEEEEEEEEVENEEEHVREEKEEEEEEEEEDVREEKEEEEEDVREEYSEEEDMREKEGEKEEEDDVREDEGEKEEDVMEDGSEEDMTYNEYPEEEDENDDDDDDDDDDDYIDDELIKQLVRDIDFQLRCTEDCEVEEEEEDGRGADQDTLVRRIKRSPLRRSSSSRSSSSSSRRRSSSSSSSSSSGGGGGGWWGSRRTSSSSSSRVRVLVTTTHQLGGMLVVVHPGQGPLTLLTPTHRQATQGQGPGGSYPTGTNPQPGYPGATSGGSTGTRYPTGTNPQPGYPGAKPGGTYPTGTNPQPGYPGAKPGGTYPTGTNPQPGYPGAKPGGTYPTGTNPQPGYPGARPGGTYPTGTNPQPGYPGARPGGTYPTGTNPQPGYPGARPGGTYPTGTNPQAGYPGARPGGGYPGNTYPQPGYPTGRQPFGTYPTNTNYGYPGYSSSGYPSTGYSPGGVNKFGQPHVSYPGAYQSYGGFPTRTYHSYPGAAMAGGVMGPARGFGGYPVGGYPRPVKTKKKGLKNKVKDGIKTAVAAYAIHKATKKAKFFSPMSFGGYGHGYRGFGGGHYGGHGMGGYGMGGFGGYGLGHKLGGGLGGKLGVGLAGLAVAKTGKKLLGAYIKLKIAKYALKFGAEAAKAYFLYKMGIELDDYMVGKFVHRYHQHRVRGDSRWRYYHHHKRTKNNNGNTTDEDIHDNITLGEFCRRPCVDNDTRVCQFSFDVHLYQAMSRACYHCPQNKTDCERPECVTGDGTRRLIITVNRAVPGPPIEVCVGDKILVDVMNNHPSTSVSLHWHGQTMGPTASFPSSRPTPYMDGTPGVTQCPIPPGSGFRYAFFASNPGTHFWRAQSGLERGEGLYGAFIVHQSLQKDPNQFLSEHVMVISDWYHKSQTQLWSQRHTSGATPTPQAILINGKGAKVVGGDGGGGDDSVASVPPARVMVENGTRYRLRVINAASSNCPITLTIDSHPLILLAVDGGSVSPVNTTTLLINTGERYDAMFSAEAETNEDGTTYWITVKGGGHCANLTQYAALQYLPTNFSLAEDIPDPSPVPSAPVHTSKTEFSGGCDVDGQRCLAHLTSSLPMPQTLKAARATHTFYLVLTASLVHNPHYYNLIYYDGSDDAFEDLVRSPQINYLSFRPPPKPLLSNPRILRSENCSSEAVRVSQCTAGYCECLHMLKVPLNDTVDLVLIADVDPEGPSEPMHLHGHTFRLLSQVHSKDLPSDPPHPYLTTTTTPIPIPDDATIKPGPPSDTPTTTTTTTPAPLPPLSLRDKVVEWDKRGELVRGLQGGVQKDSVVVPPGGYTIVRFTADNPGVWLLESEVSFQALGGMAMILHVGHTRDVPASPPPDHPTC